MPNSWHKAVNDFPGRVAATTNLTFFSSTSIVFHDILYTPPLATLARECKGCPETFCKGCHETEHKRRLGGAPFSFPYWFLVLPTYTGTKISSISIREKQL